MIRSALQVLLALMVAACTCSKVDEPPPNQVNLTATPKASTSAAPTGPEPTIDLESMPVEEDYEEEAEKAITPKNLLKQVDELEREISAPAR